MNCERCEEEIGENDYMFTPNGAMCMVCWEDMFGRRDHERYKKSMEEKK